MEELGAPFAEWRAVFLVHYLLSGSVITTTRVGIEGKNSFSVNFIIIVLLSQENFEKYGQNWPSKPSAATIRCVQTSKHYLDVPKLITLTCDIVAGKHHSSISLKLP